MKHWTILSPIVLEITKYLGWAREHVQKIGARQYDDRLAGQEAITILNARIDYLEGVRKTLETMPNSDL